MIGFPIPKSTPGRALVALVAGGSLLLAGCTSDPVDEGGERPPGSQATADTATLAGRSPLTGRRIVGARPKRPVTVVKIDNTAASAPQVGLSKADLVVEQLVEGGSTRLAVFYHSELPRRAGPVRSMRATDIGIVKPADGVLVASGGAGPTIRRMRQAGIRTVTEGGPGFSRDSGRSSLYSLFVDLSRLTRRLPAGSVPDPYLPWGSVEDFPAGHPARPARGLEAEFSGGHTTTWEYRNGRYTNVDGYAAAGDRFRPHTVLVLRVKVGDAGYLDPAGNPVPETRLTGSGEAMVFHGGKVVRAQWQKNGPADSLALKRQGKALEIPPGNVWVELVPRDGGAVRIRG